MRIRRALAEDLPALREIYRDSVEVIGPSAYSGAQVRAWADVADLPLVEATICSNTTWVAELEDRVAGFCTLEPDGHVALLYVLGALNRRGVGSALLAWTLEHADVPAGTQFYAEASEFSRALFERFGFTDVRAERVVWNGAEFLRYNVRRPN